jgi:hypothetical protein
MNHVGYITKKRTDIRYCIAEDDLQFFAALPGQKRVWVTPATLKTAGFRFMPYIHASEELLTIASAWWEG